MKNMKKMLLTSLAVMFMGINVSAAELTSTEIDKFFDSISPTETFKILAVKPDTPDEMQTVWGIIEEYLVYDYKDEYNFTCDSMEIENDKLPCKVEKINKAEPWNEGTVIKEKEFKIEWAPSNKEIEDYMYEKIAPIAKEIQELRAANPDDIVFLEFKLTDLNLINYYASFTTDDETAERMNNAINYSSELRKKFDNENFSYMVVAGMGSGYYYDYRTEFMGFFGLKQNGILYAAVDGLQVTKENVIYIPTDTAKDPTTFMDAAKKRIKDYLGYDVKITQAGKLSEMEQFLIDIYGDAMPVEFDKTDADENGLDAFYKVEFNNCVRYFLISADSSKMTKKEDIAFVSKDSKNNITVSSTDASVPLDTTITTNKETDIEKYQKALNDKNVHAYSINLNSIEKTDFTLVNGEYIVTIPVPKELNGKTIMAYYLDEVNNEIETYETTVKDGFATFKTKHFSTYVLAEKNTKVNPNTGDNLPTYIIIGLISLLGLTITGYKLKRD